ncbi:MAG: serine/threonine protein kinase [Firmicutes bacterium]|nr:serine/threonine protein kinase [Bacillota bacterium]
MRRTNKNICLYCFGDLNAERECGACAKKADDSPSPLHHLPQRTIINKRYLFGKALGEGGFGITYLAWDIHLETKVAIKEYFPTCYATRTPKSNQVIINCESNKAASNRGLKRFIDEARTLTKLKHLPGIVTVHDFFTTNGTAYIVMEFLDGSSLKKYLARQDKLPVDKALAIIKPLIESLEQMHKIGLIHRDISPDNIIINKKREIKLIDFGTAKQSNLDGKTLSIVLKQGYAPEEQYRSHGEQGPWTDIYAIGVTIYYCLTGKMPPESIQRMYKDNILKPSELGVEISEQQEKALMKSLAVYSKNRYQDCGGLLKALYGQANGSKQTTMATSGTKVATTPTPKQKDSTPKTIAKKPAKPPTKTIEKKPAKKTKKTPEKKGLLGRLFGKKK